MVKENIHTQIDQLLAQRQRQYNQYMLAKLEECNRKHAGSLTGGIKNWFAKVGPTGAAGAAIPKGAAVASIAIAASGAAAIAAGVAIPATVLFVSIVLFGWTKWKAAGVKAAIEDYYFNQVDVEGMKGAETGAQVTIQVNNNQITLSPHTSGKIIDKLDDRRCRQWLTYLASEGIDSLFSACRKLPGAQEKWKRSIKALQAGVKANPKARQNKKLYAKAAEDLCYLYRRTIRHKLFRFVLLHVAISVFLEHEAENSKADRSMRESIHYLREYSGYI